MTHRLFVMIRIINLCVSWNQVITKAKLNDLVFTTYNAQIANSSNSKKQDSSTDNSFIMTQYLDAYQRPQRMFGRIMKMFLAWITPEAAQPEVVVECEWHIPVFRDTRSPISGLPKVTRWENFDRCKYALLKTCYAEGCCLWPAHIVGDSGNMIIVPNQFNVILNRGDRSVYDDLRKRL